ncbi:MAG: hypothetical protein IH946_03350 [Bacteroidetes bacterium]|nr:hypothetical protein [Bacteroidota bacterium]
MRLLLAHKYAHIVAFLLVATFVFSACKKEDKVDIVPDNDAPYYDEIPTVLIENYVNRIFIDLIGREPLDDEMDTEVQLMRDNDIDIESRVDLIRRLQTDLNWVEGDSSYSWAYYHRIYELSKVRLLEGASNGDVYMEIGLASNDYYRDSLNEDTIGMQFAKRRLDKLYAIIDSEVEYFEGDIEIAEMYARMVNNSLYDFINMNTFNFINATFDNLLFRYPTEDEFYNAFDMIEYNSSRIILQKPGQNKADYIEILTTSREFYEGMIRWTYITLLAREPGSTEVEDLINDFWITHDFLEVQKEIMISDEYANF